MFELGKFGGRLTLFYMFLLLYLVGNDSKSKMELNSSI